MCYIFNCFGWALDFIQRTLTFILACILCCVIGIGIIIAIAAGVAYGYNYSMAEFLTFTRQDVTVYMRRGQFYDKPDFDMDRDLISRRSGDNDDAFGSNKSVDYQDTNTGSNVKALPDTWSQIQDTRKYAEVLTKFSKRPDGAEQIIKPTVISSTIKEESEDILVTEIIPSEAPVSAMLPVRRVSISPNPRVVATTLMQSGSSQIIMRNFQSPVHDLTDTEKPEYRLDEMEEKSFYMDEETDRKTQFLPEEASRLTLPVSLPPPDKFNEKQSMGMRPVVPMRHWGRKPEDIPMDYRDDIDEDNVVYKPV